jgi:hypothetical protein
MSRCIKRFCICNFQSILLRLIAREKLQLADDAMSGKLETFRFLKTAIGTGIAGTSSVQQGKSRRDGRGEDMGNVLATNSASAAVCLEPSVSSKGIELLQRGVCRDTAVTLPGG